MLIKGIGRTFSTENNQQYETIRVFWDELVAKHGRANLQGLGYRIIKVEDGFTFYQKRKSEPNTIQNFT